MNYSLYIKQTLKQGLIALFFAFVFLFVTVFFALVFPPLQKWASADPTAPVFSITSSDPSTGISFTVDEVASYDKCLLEGNYTFGSGWSSDHTLGEFRSSWGNLSNPMSVSASPFSSWLGGYTGNIRLHVNCELSSPPYSLYDTNLITTVYPLTSPAPPAPTLTGTSGNHQNTLNWTTCTSATGYTLKQGSTTIYTGTLLTYTDTGLTNGTSYSYTVTCTTTATSDPSTALTLTPTYAPPSIPTGFTDRDIQLFSFAIALFLAYTVIKTFRWVES